jgi:hypothetical protein
VTRGKKGQNIRSTNYRQNNNTKRKEIEELTVSI